MKSAKTPPPGRIGIFDSGIGGLSILKAVHARLPHHPLLYFADSAHAPYGERSDAYVLQRSQHIAAELMDRGCDVLVIACNTATAVAANALRLTWPQTAIIGVEPGIKPAVLASKNHRVGVLATRSTLQSLRFQRLLTQHGGTTHIVTQACTGLALAIESGDLQSTEVRGLVEQYCAPLRAAEVDTVVLGCTHYTFAREAIQTAMGPDVQLLDTAEAVARETVRRVEAISGMQNGVAASASAPAQSSVDLLSSGPSEPLAAIARRWLPFECVVRDGGRTTI